MIASTTRSRRVASRLGGAFTKWAQIIGVTVSDTTVETTMANTSVIENSRSRRPTTPSMNSSGMKAATSDTLIEMTVKPICLAPSSAACMGRMPASRLRNMFSIMTMASSTTKPTETASAIEREVVDGEAGKPHARAGAGQRQRHRHAGGDGRRRPTQEDVDDEHDEHDRQPERDLHVEHAGADGAGAVGEHGDVDARGDPALDLRDQLADAVDRLDDVGGRPAW